MPGWVEVPCPPGCEPGARKYAKPNGLSLIVGKDPHDGLWHLSIAHPERLPTWAEIKGARYRFLPNDAWVAQVLPPREEYVNEHSYCLHLWEIPELAARHRR